MSNDRQQTAMQQLIDETITYSRELSVKGNLYESMAVDTVIDNMEKMLNVEKQRLKDAYWAGIDDHLNPNKMPNSEGYYEFTFGGNNENI